MKEYFHFYKLNGIDFIYFLPHVINLYWNISVILIQNNSSSGLGVAGPVKLG